MSSNRPVNLSEEQIALSLARKAKKQDAAPVKVPTERGKILVRDWIHTRDSKTFEGNRVKLMTWNMLAQCLVRRELFPTSDCLKASQREDMLVNEILTYKPDISCLQEVDRLEKLLPPLHDASYAEAYAAGVGKRHGCVIIYRDAIFKKTCQEILCYDDLNVWEAEDQHERKGSSRLTKNIGLIVGLQRRNQLDSGYIIATTHLFWHPSFTYERARQAGLLLREVVRFREANSLQNWPCLIAGDFNFTPTDPAYSLLVGDPLTASQARNIAVSRVVHVSIDPSAKPMLGPPKDDDEGDAAQGDPDRVITNARQAIKEDGLLSDQELQLLFPPHSILRSVYDEGQQVTHDEHGENVYAIGAREDIAAERKGRFEPMWTSYTHYWKNTLDYIFILDPVGQRSDVLGFLPTHRTTDLQPGLPLKGVCASDHISLVAEIGTTRT